MRKIIACRDSERLKLRMRELVEQSPEGATVIPDGSYVRFKNGNTEVYGMVIQPRLFDQDRLRGLIGFDEVDFSDVERAIDDLKTHLQFEKNLLMRQWKR